MDFFFPNLRGSDGSMSVQLGLVPKIMDDGSVRMMGMDRAQIH